MYILRWCVMISNDKIFHILYLFLCFNKLIALKEEEIALDPMPASYLESYITTTTLCISVAQ